MGCGTSGRLGILDAAEDSKELGEEDLKKIHACEKDVVVGLAASGRTPYVIGGMEYAKSIGIKVVGVTCCKGSIIDELADIGIVPMPGPEVVTGSTRMKSGTCQKLVLNMLSTGAMIKLGKVYGNLMVDVKPSNEKLINRCISSSCNGKNYEIAGFLAFNHLFMDVLRAGLLYSLLPTI